MGGTNDPLSQLGYHLPALIQGWISLFHGVVTHSLSFFSFLFPYRHSTY